MKKILDATCGGRMMWFDKNHPDTIYCDIRKETIICCDGRILNVDPDVIADFTKLPFDDQSFSLVVFDPPHLKRLGKKSWLAQKYGKLFTGWEIEINEGIKECMRVLKPDGVLIFKWNENQIKVHVLLKSIEYVPLFGQRTSRSGDTIWMTFMKEINQ